MNKHYKKTWLRIKKVLGKIVLVLFCAIKMSREWVFVTIDSGKTTQDGEKRFFHDGNNLKTPVSSS